MGNVRCFKTHCSVSSVGRRRLASPGRRGAVAARRWTPVAPEPGLDATAPWRVDAAVSNRVGARSRALETRFVAEGALEEGRPASGRSRHLSCTCILILNPYARIVWRIIFYATGLTPPRSIRHMFHSWLANQSKEIRNLIWVGVSSVC